MSERPTPETDAALRDGMTAIQTLRMLQRLELERDEALSGWKRVSLEAEHWLSLASKRKDDLDEANAIAARTCQWTEDEDGNWDTGCGECFSFADGKPSQNKQRFCGYCGGRLVEKEYRHEQET